MKQLIDSELIDKILIGEIIKKGFPDPYCNFTTHDNRWYDKDSPVQPASIDLHVGEIYIPTEKAIPHDKFSLSTGQTIIVTTLEELNLPSNISAFGFPPDNLSQQGILMVNLGHIDPGWKGKIKFVLINVGKSDFDIKKEDLVGTFLFFELDSNVGMDYRQRRPNINFPLLPKVSDISLVLSKDFLDVSKRTKEIISKSTDRIMYNTLIITLISSVFLISIGYFFNDSYSKEINKMNIEVQSLKESKSLRTDYEYHKLKNKVDSLEKTIYKFDTQKKK